jgi:hypothetical protein
MNALPNNTAFSRGVDAGPASRTRAMRLVVENRKQAMRASRKFPPRPTLQVISETIPLFYICQNRHGFWIARDAEGQSGGLFLRRQSALRFAQRRSAPTGCAIMQLSELAELDIENKGSHIAAALGTLVSATMQHAPRLAAFFGMTIAEWHKLVTEISATFASARKHRAAAERELFRGECCLSSKCDDDLPVY